MAHRRPTLSRDSLLGPTKPNDLENYKDALWNRTMSLFDEMEGGELGRECISFETLLSAFYFFEDGFDHDDIKEAYHLKAWQEETVTIPKGLLEPLIEAWVKYKGAPTGTSIGECLNLEGGSQGKHQTRQKIALINKRVRYSNGVLTEYLQAKDSRVPVSWETAYGIVAEREGVSESTVKRASEKYIDRTIERLKERGYVD